MKEKYKRIKEKCKRMKEERKRMKEERKRIEEKYKKARFYTLDDGWVMLYDLDAYMRATRPDISKWLRDLMKASGKCRHSTNTAQYALCVGFLEGDCHSSQERNQLQFSVAPKKDVGEDGRKGEMKEFRAEVDSATALMEALPSSFSLALEAHIKRSGLSAEKLAERCDISVRTLSDYRHGRGNPEVQSVLALCVGLELGPIMSYHLLYLAGYPLPVINAENCVYRYLLDHCWGKFEDIHTWNERLCAAGITQTLPRRPASIYACNNRS